MTTTSIKAPEILGCTDITPPAAKWLKLKSLQVGLAVFATSLFVPASIKHLRH
jgi:hypothetical protein